MYGYATDSGHVLLGTERQERIFIESGTGPTHTFTITVDIAVPTWANSVQDVVTEYVRWLNDDLHDALGGTRIKKGKTEVELPLYPEGVCQDCGSDDTEEDTDEDGESFMKCNACGYEWEA